MREESRLLYTQLAQGAPPAYPTQAPERSAARPRPSVAPGWLSPAEAAAAADAEFPEDWPAREPPVAVTAAPPVVDAALAAAPWRRAARPAPEGEADQAPTGAAEPAPEGRPAESSPAAEAAASSEDEGSSTDSERAEEGARLAAVARHNQAATASEPEEPAADYAVSLSSEGLSGAEGAGSTPNSPRSPPTSPATPEAYYEDFERLEICSIGFSNHDGSATGSTRGAAAGNDGASGSSGTGARPAAGGRGRPAWAKQRPPWKVGRGRGGHATPRKAPRLQW